MTDHTLLETGLGCLFLALLLVGVLWQSRPTASAVSRSLAALDHVNLQRTGRSVATEPLADRALRPVQGALGVIGRRLSPSGYAGRLQSSLDKAGNPDRVPLERLFALKALGLIVAGTLGLLIGLRHGAAALMFAMVGGGSAFMLPDLLVYNSGIKRQETIQRSLPDALDMLTVSVEAGLGFDAALSQVARNTQGPIAREFYRVLQEMQIGKSRTDALRGLGERTTVPDLKTFTSAIVQADTLGIPVANVLREQAKEMRLKRHQRAQEQAQKVTVKIMFPLVFCILPSLFVIVIGPGALSIIHAFSHH